MSAKIAEQLAKTQRELEKLKAEYHAFVYVASHDLSAPLRQIEGFADLIATKYAEIFDDKSKRHFKLMIGGSVNAKRLLDALVEYSRLEANTGAFGPVDCNDIVAEALKQLSSLAIGAKADISYAKLPKIVADKGKISQVFYHLIHNALLYQHPDSHPKIRIEVEELKHLWRFSIIDNGIGIQHTLTEKIFKVLRRGVSDKKFPGMGMGLALSKKIVHQHEGEICLKSSGQEGLSFCFTLSKDLQHE